MILCFATTISVFQIRNRDIDNSQARADDKENEHGQQRTTVKNLTLAGIAAVGLGWSLIKMPETKGVARRGVAALEGD
ncbi:MAG: hypothetical protein PUP91_20360 [Rhizonema sp. PD37]|nr:hypothetical protein [Rhizonema sp. PD37]